jgi:hypothetical protein
MRVDWILPSVAKTLIKILTNSKLVRVYESNMQSRVATLINSQAEQVFLKVSLISLLSRVYGQQVFLDKFFLVCTECC